MMNSTENSLKGEREGGRKKRTQKKKFKLKRREISEKKVRKNIKKGREG